MASRKKKTEKKLPQPPEGETLLFARLKKGDDAARDELVKKYSSWVTNIARKYHAFFPAIELNELIAEGNRGLMEALHRYVTTKATKFSTYAWFWILKNIQEYISSSIALIGVPGKNVLELKKIVASMNEDMKRGSEPSLERISKKLGMDLGTVTDLLADKKNLSHPLSLDKYLDDDDREQTLGDIVEDKNVAAIQKIIEQSDSEINILELLGQLSSMEQEIIKWRFGFNDNQSHALKEIGEKLKLPPAKVKDIEYMALIKLKRLLGKSDKYDSESL
ncbi:MAG: sigma-70 family RNA polymerase sigma factor [Endomicrobiales bacterium]